MKKLLLLVLCTVVFTGCEIDDDAPYFVHEYAPVLNADLPRRKILNYIKASPDLSNLGEFKNISHFYPFWMPGKSSFRFFSADFIIPNYLQIRSG